MHSRVFRIKRRIALLVCHPSVGRLVGVLFQNRLPHHGVTIHTDNRSVAPAVKAQLLWGLYEHAETDFVREYLPKNLDVIELGSSLGVVSAHIARRIDSEKTLICVEANPALVAEIDRNVRSNVPDQELKVVNAAIDYGGSTNVVFSVERVHVDSRVGGERGAANTIEVPAITLACLIEEYGIENYSLVMDIEGAEASLLNQDVGALEACRFIVAELHEVQGEGDGRAIAKMVDRLEGELGFEIAYSRGDVYAFRRRTFPAS